MGKMVKMVKMGKATKKEKVVKKENNRALELVHHQVKLENFRPKNGSGK